LAITKTSTEQHNFIESIIYGLALLLVFLWPYILFLQCERGLLLLMFQQPFKGASIAMITAA